MYVQTFLVDKLKKNHWVSNVSQEVKVLLPKLANPKFVPELTVEGENEFLKLFSDVYKCVP